MSTPNHWTKDAMKRAERLVGEAAETLEGRPLGIAANYLQAAADWLMAEDNAFRRRDARRQYLFAQAQERDYRGSTWPRQAITEAMADDIIIKGNILTELEYKRERR